MSHLPIQKSKSWKMSAFMVFSDQIEQLPCHKDLKDDNHGPNVEMTHVDNKSKSQNHPQR